MRILYIHRVPLDTQKANLIQVLHMCQALARAAADVTLVIPSYRRISNAAASVYLSEQIGDLVRFEVRAIARAPASQRVDRLVPRLWLPSDILRGSWDWCYLRSPALLGPARAAGLDVVFESHGKWQHQGLRFLDRRYRSVVVQSSKEPWFRALVAISDGLRRYWIGQGVPETKAVTAHDGFSAKAFSSVLDRDEARLRCGLPEGRRLAMYVGSLYPNRRPGRLLEVAEAIPELTVVAVGGPNDEVHTLKREAEARGLDNLIFVGHVPHRLVPEYLAAADILLALWSEDVPTIEYCSPLKVFEYMAASRTIVAEGFPSIREVLRHEVNALLFEPGDLPALIHMTREAVFGIRRDDLAGAARQEALTEYSWDRRARRILSSAGVNGAPWTNSSAPVP